MHLHVPSIWCARGALLCRKLMLIPLCRYVVQTYARPEIVFTHGEGSRMYDAYGNEYLDFAAGIAVNALGESQPYDPWKSSSSTMFFLH